MDYKADLLAQAVRSSSHARVWLVIVRRAGMLRLSTRPDVEVHDERAATSHLVRSPEG